MILVDTAIWVDHLRRGHRALQQLLQRGLVLGHPWVSGELGLGHLTNRKEVLGLLRILPTATVVTWEEMLFFIERHRLMGRGNGFVDVQLLAATQLTPDATLWTSDRRLAESATELGLAADVSFVGDAV